MQLLAGNQLPVSYCTIHSNPFTVQCSDSFEDGPCVSDTAARHEEEGFADNIDCHVSDSTHSQLRSHTQPSRNAIESLALIEM